MEAYVNKLNEMDNAATIVPKGFLLSSA